MAYKLNRRNFIKNLGGFMLAASFGHLFSLETAKAATKAKGAAALPAGQNSVPATDAVAQAIGYQSDIKNVDYAKYPQRKKPEAKNQFCKSCALYTPSNDGWGKCSMLTSGLVAAEGWCASWNKKS